MDLGLSGRVAWVTGGSSGLGHASALSLAREGATVAISSRDAEKLDRAAAEIADETGSNVVAVPLDVGDADAIGSAHEAVVSRLGPVEILVANAGGPPPGGFDAFEDDVLYDAFTLTTASAWRLTKAAVPAMREKGRGVIIYLTSNSTKEVIPTLLLSNMMRAAVVGMAKTLSKGFAADGIRVLCVAPGRIGTDRLGQLDEAAAQSSGRSPEEVKEQNVSAIPAGRYGDPSEFGDVVAFLASDRASYVTGVSVSVDGGALNFILS